MLSSYDFKREFGGYLEPVYHGEVAPSRLGQALLAVSPQPTWQRTRGDVATRTLPVGPTEIAGGMDVQWAGPPSHCATRPDVLLEAWTVDDAIMGHGQRTRAAPEGEA